MLFLQSIHCCTLNEKGGVLVKLRNVPKRVVVAAHKLSYSCMHYISCSKLRKKYPGVLGCNFPTSLETCLNLRGTDSSCTGFPVCSRGLEPFNHFKRTVAYHNYKEIPNVDWSLTKLWTKLNFMFLNTRSHQTIFDWGILLKLHYLNLPISTKT
jgi:hypothetical protein